jgi:hypothetical protein
MDTMVLITGNTFPVKDAIKSLGGKWDNDAKGWRVPSAVASEARELVNNVPRRNVGGNNTPRAVHHGKCLVCGTHEGPIYRSGECRDCFEERKMGY